MTKMYRMNADDSYVGVVFTTKDYTKFRKLEGNREVTEQRKTRIRRSVEENGQIFTVVTVNEKLQVIDGQGRIEVFREMGLPVSYVVVPGLSAKDCAVLNATTTVWKLDDYIAMYCSQNMRPYILLRELLDRHKSISMNSVGFALSQTISSGKNDAAGISFNTKVKEGTLEASESEFAHAEKKIAYAERFLVNGGVSGRKECLITAAIFAYNVIPDREMLIDKWDKYSKLKSIERPIASVVDAMTMLESCYNYKSKAKDAFYLTSEYDKYKKTRQQTSSERKKTAKGA